MSARGAAAVGQRSRAAMRRSAVAPPAAPGWCLRSGKLSDHVASQRKDLTRTRVDCPIVSNTLRVLPARIDKDEVLPAITVVKKKSQNERQENPHLFFFFFCLFC